MEKSLEIQIVAGLSQQAVSQIKDAKYMEKN